MGIRIDKSGAGHFQPRSSLRESADETQLALRHLLAIGIAAALGVSTTYAIPALSPYRPWITGDGPPFQAWFGAPSDEELPAFGGKKRKAGGAGVKAEAVKAGGVSEAEMREAEEVAALGGEEEELDRPPIGDAAPIGDAPNHGPEAVAADGEVDPGDQPAGVEPVAIPEPGEVIAVPAVPKPVHAPTPVTQVDLTPAALAEEYKDIAGEIELATNLDSFYAKLLRTAQREAGAVTRITHYGASEIGADGMTSFARRKLQQRFGSAGKGWVNVAPGWEWYKHKDVVYKTRGWTSRTVTSDDLNGKIGGSHYGFGGVAGLGSPGDEASYRVYADRFELFYLGHPKGGTLGISVNGGPEELLSTAAEAETDLTKVFRGTPGIENTVIIKNKLGNTHVYGVTLETDGPGVVYDCIQLIGTRASRFLNFDEEHLKRQTELRKPDLQIILYGGNELGDTDMALAPYEKKYKEVIRRMRAGAPGASCIVMAPQDHGEIYRGRVRTVPLLKELIPIQRRIAEESGCGFFNTFEAMGGEGTMGRWYNSKPRLSSGDFAHLTPAGDSVLGGKIYKAIMKGLADYLARQP